jgi:hypothetical protein
MINSEENSTHWSRDEWDLINVTEIFRRKPAILKKVEGYLEELRTALADELKTHPKSYPPDTDLTKGQIVRGENHKGFPFLSLDMPQKFSKTEFFTYRTLETYLNRMIEYRQDATCENIYLSQHNSPWEWEFSDTHFTKISELSRNKIQEIADRLQYLKLMRFFPVSDKSFPELNWTQAGVQSFRDLIHLVME